MAGTARVRLIGAVERLCLERAPSKLTMRAIAEEAGVSVGLAYHHFASKDELMGAALDHLAGQVAERSASAPDPAEGLLQLWALLGRFPAFPRIVTSLILEDRDVTALMSGHPLIRETAAIARSRGHADPESVGAVIALLGLAGAMFGPTANRAAGRDDADDRLYGAAAEMFEVWFGGPR